MNIHADLNITEVQQLIEDYPDQLRFSAMRAINYTLLNIQEAERYHMGEVFNIRKQDFANKSVKIKPFATKSTLTGTVGIDSPGGRSDIFSKFETDTSKQSISGGSIAVPSDNIKRNKNDIITNANRPRQLKNSFIVNGKNGAKYIMFTVGRGKRRLVELAYTLVKSVTLKPVLGFEEVAQATFDKNWNDNFNRAYDEAIATRKTPEL